MKAIHVWDNSFDKYWVNGLAKISGATPMYSLGVRQFDHEIFSSILKQDDSFVVLSDSDEILALVPLYCFKDDMGVLEYRYAGEYLRAPLIDGFPSSKRYEKIQKFVFSYIEDLAREKKVISHKTMVEAVELIEGRYYYNYLTDFGYNDESSVCQLIDSSKDIDYLWADIRKSYRPLINRAEKNFSCEIVSFDNYSFDKCEEYRKLHFNATGRQTRDIKSFYLMYDMVKNKQAFISFVIEKDDQIVASHFFYVLGAYCLYASSAIDPDMPHDCGIGHFGMWQGIKTAHDMGCSFIDMGQLRLTSNPSDKEMNIALFKKGFGGRTVTVFRGTKTFFK